MQTTDKPRRLTVLQYSPKSSESEERRLVVFEVRLKTHQREWTCFLRFERQGRSRRIVGRPDFSTYCTSDLEIDDLSIAPNQAMLILVDDKELLVVDVLSKFGTFIDGRRLEKGESRSVLGKVVRFGNTLATFRRISEISFTPNPELRCA